MRTRPRTQRRAYRQFAFAPHHAREIQVGDIGAGNQQYKSSGREEHQHGRPRVVREFVAQGDGLDRIIQIGGVSVGVRFLKIGGHRGKVRLRLPGINVRLHSRENMHHARGATLNHALAGAERACGRGHVHVVLVGILRDRRKNADNRVNSVVHGERLANDGGIAAKTANPVFVAKQ